jgi:predicted transcriptional regulator
MARPPSKYPTELELEILKVLWHAGALPVRDVRDRLASFRDLAHTSVITIMNIMVKKGYLKRTRQGASYVYAACVTEADTARRFVGDLVNRVFDGSAASLMTYVVQTADIDAEELARLKRIIDLKTKEREK